jgi:hypothetical protein
LEIRLLTFKHARKKLIKIQNIFFIKFDFGFLDELQSVLELKIELLTFLEKNRLDFFKKILFNLILNF